MAENHAEAVVAVNNKGKEDKKEGDKNSVADKQVVDKQAAVELDK